MTNEIEAKVKEFVEIAKTCPQNLQEKCFELLMGKYLEQRYGVPAAGTKATMQGADDAGGGEGAAQEDLAETDLHVKARKFLEKNGLTIGDINQIFYKEGSEVMPLYEDLKSTKVSECQLRIALLLALKSGIQGGAFEFDGEVVREECRARKCYDQANFATIFKNNKELFEGFEKYKKTSPMIQLSGEGKEKLASVVKELK